MLTGFGTLLQIFSMKSSIYSIIVGFPAATASLIPWPLFN